MAGFGTKPLVSVIIPTHNRCELLGEALNSVYAQEGAGEDFELDVVVVDDASSDKTPESLERYPGVRYIRLETNRGGSGARNEGIRASRGEFVAFLDDDDLWLPGRVKTHLPTLQADPHIGAVYGQGIMRLDGAEYAWPEASRAPSGSVFQAFLREDFLSIDTLMVRRTVFHRAGYFDESLRILEHYDMGLRLAFHAPVVFVPGTVAVCRVSDEGAWLSGIKTGAYKETLPLVIEKALSMLPVTAESAEIQRAARLDVFGRIVGGLSYFRRYDLMREYVQESLSTSPSMWLEASVRNALAEGAARLARASDAPITDVRTLFTNLVTTVGATGFRERRQMRRLLADAWTKVALGLASGPRRRYRAAGRAALEAAFQDPSQVFRRRGLLWLMARALTGPRDEDGPRAVLGAWNKP